MEQCTHKPKEVLDELFSPHTYHRFLAVSAEKLVRDFDKLRVSVKPLKPTLFAVVAGLVKHVEQMAAHTQPDVLDREVFASQRAKQPLRYDWRVAFGIGPEFGRNALVSLGRACWFRCWCLCCACGFLN